LSTCPTADPARTAHHWASNGAPGEHTPSSSGSTSALLAQTPQQKTQPITTADATVDTTADTTADIPKPDVRQALGHRARREAPCSAAHRHTRVSGVTHPQESRPPPQSHRCTAVEKYTRAQHAAPWAVAAHLEHPEGDTTTAAPSTVLTHRSHASCTPSPSPSAPPPPGELQGSHSFPRPSASAGSRVTGGSAGGGLVQGRGGGRGTPRPTPASRLRARKADAVPPLGIRRGKTRGPNDVRGGPRRCPLRS
jgi:hypothetical protein